MWVTDAIGHSKVKMSAIAKQHGNTEHAPEHTPRCRRLELQVPASRGGSGIHDDFFYHKSKLGQILMMHWGLDWVGIGGGQSVVWVDAERGVPSRLWSLVKGR